MPDSFSFSADRAIQRALGKGTTILPLTFVATGPVVDGKTSAPRAASRVQVAQSRIAVETRRRRR